MSGHRVSPPRKTTSTTPWITIILGVLLVFNPIGFAFIGQAMSGDPLASGIATPFVMIGVVFLLVGFFIETVIRRLRRNAQPPQ